MPQASGKTTASTTGSGRGRYVDEEVAATFDNDTALGPFPLPNHEQVQAHSMEGDFGSTRVNQALTVHKHIYGHAHRTFLGSDVTS